MCIREFDLSFQRTYLEESDDDTESKRPKRKGFSADRMPGEYHNYRNGDDRGVTKNKSKGGGGGRYFGGACARCGGPGPK